MKANIFEKAWESSVIPDSCFRSYDIRGEAPLVTNPEALRNFAMGVAAEARKAGVEKLVLGRDSRPDSIGAHEALMKLLSEEGFAILDAGFTTTPALELIAELWKDGEYGGSSIMVTASHNDEGECGFKISFKGSRLHGPRIKAIRNAMREACAESFKNAGKDPSEEGKGEEAREPGVIIHASRQLVDFYIRKMTEVFADAQMRETVRREEGVDIPMSPPRLAINLNGGANILYVKKAIGEFLGAEVVVFNAPREALEDETFAKDLFDDSFVDGGELDEKEHDPAKHENLEKLAEILKNGHPKFGKFDLGMAFDPDGDRIGVVLSSGRKLFAHEWVDLLTLAFGKTMTRRIFDLDSIAANYIHSPLFKQRTVADAVYSYVVDPKLPKVIVTTLDEDGVLKAVDKRNGMRIAPCGHDNIAKSMLENDALFGIEGSCHVYTRWQGRVVDDALENAIYLARLWEVGKRVLAKSPDVLCEDSRVCLKRFVEGGKPVFEYEERAVKSEPLGIGEVELFWDLINIHESEQENLIQRYGCESISFVDGMRLEFEDGHILLRLSNTSLRMELSIVANEVGDVGALAMEELVEKARDLILISVRELNCWGDDAKDLKEAFKKLEM